jgi:hypothetical protein
MDRRHSLVLLAALLPACAQILGIEDVTLGDASTADASDGGGDASPLDAQQQDVVSPPDTGPGVCTPNDTRSCGTSGTQTCGPTGYWCNCIGDAPQTCTGTGTFAGCRGDGCYVCQEKLTGFSCYFKNHPNCALNTTCAGSFFACSTQCPAPTSEDSCTCVSAPTGWQECGNTACSVCTDQTQNYACYFLNHPTCLKENNCTNQRIACSQYCPAPVAQDRGMNDDGGLAP